MRSIVRQNTKVTSSYIFTTADNKPLQVDVEDFYFVDGQLSMGGTVHGSENSSFLLKGTDESIYGWVALKDQNIAYEYTTNDAGVVIVEKIPVSKVITICDIQPPKGYCDCNYMDVNWMQGFYPPIPHIGEYDGSSVNELESLPGADKVFYLDITRIMDGEKPTTLGSKAEMWIMWQCVASTLSMYHINVTTSRSVYDKAGVPNSGIATFLDQSGIPNADFNSFGTTKTSRNYKTVWGGYGLGTMAAHEIGHQLGLQHDGGPPSSGGSYFTGFAEYKWVPVMGSYRIAKSWGNDGLLQWSKGEYDSATSQQDDLQAIAKYLEFREDDFTDITPLIISGDGKVSAESNRGQIHFTTDSDEFSFEIGNTGGHVNLTIDRIEHIGGAMLDVHAEIKDASGNVIEESNVPAARYAEFDLDLDKGNYILLIKGGAEGTPQNGFSNYSSLGFYSIDGTITGAIGIKENNNVNKSIGICPVYSGAKLNLDIPKNVKVEKISLHTTNGVRVYNSHQRVTSIDLSNFAVGMYVLRIAYDGTNLVKNFVKW
ncbi:zinc-dependent metalloprotease [Fibrobacterota bacterium]